MPAVRIKVGVSVDSSVARMFEPFAKAVARANQTLSDHGKAAKKASADVSNAAKEQVRAWIAADKNVAAAHKAGDAEAVNQAKSTAAKLLAVKKAEAAEEKMIASRLDRDILAMKKEKAAEEVALAKKTAALEKQIAKAAADAEKEAGGGGGGGFASGFARFAARRMIWGAGAYAVGMAGRLAGGMGVDPQDMSGMIAKNVARRDLATDIANVGYIPGAAGPNGQRQCGAAIDADAMKIALETGSDPQKILEGLQKFVAVTGDLKTGRDVMRDMARLALATGANMDTMVSAAGEMSARMKDTPDKAAKIEATMRRLAGMGLKGALLMQDVGEIMPQVAGLAGQMSGDVNDNIAKLVAVAQEARQGGGAGTASKAATMVNAYFNASHLDKRQAEAVALTRESGGLGFRDKRGFTRDPWEVIPEMIRGATNKQTGAVDVGKVAHALTGSRGFGVAVGMLNKDMLAMAEAFERGEPATVQFQEGLKAMAAEHEKLIEAGMTRMQVEEGVQAKLAETKQQAQLFSNKLQEIVDKSMPALTSALEKLGPAVLAAFPAFVSLTVAMMNFLAWLGNSVVARSLGISPDFNSEGSGGAANDAAKKALDDLKSSPSEATREAAKVALMGVQGALTNDVALAARQRAAANEDSGWDGSVMGHIHAGAERDAAGRTEKSVRELATMQASLIGKLSEGLPVTVKNPRDLHTPKSITRTGGPGRMPASRDDGF